MSLFLQLASSDNKFQKNTEGSWFHTRTPAVFCRVPSLKLGPNCVAHTIKQVFAA
jgi:hypothetical protein